MFLTRISPDSVIRSNPYVTWDSEADYPPRALWFKTLNAIQNFLPSHWSERLAASTLIRRWHGTDTVAAAALIADNKFIMNLPGIPENVRETALRFSKVVTAEDVAQNGETWTLIYRLVQITAAARRTAELIRGNCRIPDDREDRLRSWQAVLSAVYTYHRVESEPFSNVYTACRDAVDALADLIAPTELTWRVTGSAKDVKAFLKVAVPRCGLAYCVEEDNALLVRTTRLPLSAAVRLVDGLAAAYPRLHFASAPLGSVQSFLSSDSQPDTEETTLSREVAPGAKTFTETIDSDAHYQARIEPLFYAENVNPVPAILTSADQPHSVCRCVTGTSPEALKTFLTTVVPLFRLEVSPSDDRKSVFVRAPQLPASAATSLFAQLASHFTTLTFTNPVPLPSLKFTDGAIPNTPDFPSSSSLRPLWEEELTERFSALDDPQKRSIYLTRVFPNFYEYRDYADEVEGSLRAPAHDEYDQYDRDDWYIGDEEEAEEEKDPDRYLEDEDDGSTHTYVISFPTVRRPDGTWFYEPADIPGRTALRKMLEEKFASAEFSSPLFPVAAEDSQFKLMGNNGSFEFTVSWDDTELFEEEFLDSGCQSLDPRWECSGVCDWVDVSDDDSDPVWNI